MYFEIDMGRAGDQVKRFGDGSVTDEERCRVEFCFACLRILLREEDGDRLYYGMCIDRALHQAAVKSFFMAIRRRAFSKDQAIMSLLQHGGDIAARLGGRLFIAPMYIQG